MRRNKLIIAILFVILIGLIAVAASHIYFQEDLTEGNQNILVLALDESEPRPGIGAADMGFIVHLENGTIKNYTPVYPHGLTHPTVAEPQEYQAQGAGAKLLLHDSFYWEDTQKCCKYAKEIVEYNQNVEIDAVVGVSSSSIDVIIQAAGPLQIGNQTLNVSGIDLIREKNWGEGMDRGEAVKILARALVKASKDPNKKANMVKAAMDEYSKGKIVMYPEGAFIKLLASKGVDSIF